MKKILGFLRISLIVFLILVLYSLVIAAFTETELQKQQQLCEFCRNVKTIALAVALLMVIAAGWICAAGKVKGGETRAKANILSALMLIGGMICLILAPGLIEVALAPPCCFPISFDSCPPPISTCC